MRPILKVALSLIAAVYFGLSARHRLHEAGNGDLFVIDAIIAIGAAGVATARVRWGISSWTYMWRAKRRERKRRSSEFAEARVRAPRGGVYWNE